MALADPAGVDTVVVVATLSVVAGGAGAAEALIYTGSRENCRSYE